MRLITWNVNAFKTLTDLSGDLICLQEVKGRAVKVDGYHVFQNRAAAKGYSGVATLTTKDWRPFAVSDELFINGSKDDQGRFLLTDHKIFVLINVYFPFSLDTDPVKLSYKMQFHEAISERINALISKKRLVIVVGDFNCTYDAKDSFYTKSNAQSQMDPEINTMTEWFKHLMVDSSLIDTYRRLHPRTENSYTCWNTKLNSRIVNQVFLLLNNI